MFLGEALAYRQDYAPEDAPQYIVCRPDGKCEVVNLTFLVVDPHWYIYSFSNGVQWRVSLDDDAQTEISSSKDYCAGSDCKGWVIDEIVPQKKDLISIEGILNVAEVLRGEVDISSASEATVYTLFACKGWIKGYVAGDNMSAYRNDGSAREIVSVDANRVIQDAAAILKKDSSATAQSALISGMIQNSKVETKSKK